ncbi:MAG: hypothetical protein AAB686_01430, partial [Patescibacteria group bacterium]
REEKQKLEELEQKIRSNFSATSVNQTGSGDESKLARSLAGLKEELSRSEASAKAYQTAVFSGFESQLKSILAGIEESRSEGRRQDQARLIAELQKGFARIEKDILQTQAVPTPSSKVGQSSASSTQVSADLLQQKLFSLQGQIAALNESFRNFSASATDENQKLLRSLEDKFGQLKLTVQASVSEGASGQPLDLHKILPELRLVVSDLQALGLTEGKARNDLIESLRQTREALQESRTSKSSQTVQSEGMSPSLPMFEEEAQKVIFSDRTTPAYPAARQERKAAWFLNPALTFATILLTLAAIGGGVWYLNLEQSDKLSNLGQQLVNQFIGVNYQPVLKGPLSQDIDEAGGRVSLVKDDKLLLDLNFPEATVRQTTKITVAPVDLDRLKQFTPKKDQSIVGSQVYELTAQTASSPVSSFDKPIVLTFDYDPEKIIGYKEDDLGIFYWDESVKEWKELPDAKVDTFTHKVSASSDHFTVFALIAKTKLPASSVVYVGGGGSGIIQGPAGPIGPAGPQGPVGPQGLSGTAGAAGTNGSTYYTAPASKEGGLAGSFKYLSAENLNVENLTVSGWAGCNVETDANGLFVCGTDDTGSGSGGVASQWEAYTGDILAPTNTAASIAVGGSTSAAPVFLSPTATSTLTYGLTVDSSTLVVNANENRVGVGTAAPTSTLSVVGTVDFQRSTGASLIKIDSVGHITFATPDSQNGYGLTVATSTYFANDVAFGGGVTYSGGSTFPSATTSDTFTVGANWLGQLGVTQGAASRTGLAVRAASAATANLLELQSSTGTFLSGFTAAGGLLMNISSTTALSVQNGSGAQVFTVNTGTGDYATTTAYGGFVIATSSSALTNDPTHPVMYVNSQNGNIGIGTNETYAKLHVIGTGGAIGTRITVENLSTMDYAAVKAGNDISGTQNIFMLSSGTTRTGSQFGVNNSSAGVGLGHLYTNATPLVVGTNNSFNLTLGANGIGIMTLTPSSNVGIGLTSPTSTLSVLGEQAIWGKNTANTTLVVRAPASATNNILELQNSAGTFLSGFTAEGGLLMNIASTSALNIQNGSGVKKFWVDSSTGNATTSGYLIVGAGNPTIDLQAGDIWATRATTTNLAVTSLQTCDIKSDGNGSFYCGTDATGSGGGSNFLFGADHTFIYPS